MGADQKAIMALALLQLKRWQTESEQAHVIVIDDDEASPEDPVCSRVSESIQTACKNLAENIDKLSHVVCSGGAIPTKRRRLHSKTRFPLLSRWRGGD